VVRFDFSFAELRGLDKDFGMLRLKRVLVGLSVAGACALTVAVSGCANNQANPSAQLGPADGRGPVTPGTQRDFSVNVGDLVYFSSDSSDLTPESQSILQKQAKWLRQYPQFTITLEGHADERGTREYNIALGARRASSVRNYLAQSGVQASRIRTISYGKERPVAVCNDISCWSQNRRAQTVLNNRSAAAN
jgi:peptidoglycan-associated lipoprotein